MSEAAATEAARVLDVMSLKQYMAALKGKVDILLAGVGLLIILGTIGKFL